MTAIIIVFVIIREAISLLSIEKEKNSNKYIIIPLTQPGNDSNINNNNNNY